MIPATHIRIRSQPMNRRISCLLLAAAVALFLAPAASWAASAQEINIKVDEAMKRFSAEIAGGDEFIKASVGVLVFPNVIKAGIGIGGEYGEGALRVDGKTVEYYSTAAGSIGFQLGAQSKAVFILFMQQAALDNFRKSDGWKAGVDGSINLVKVGAGGALDTATIKDPIIGFVMTNTGLMFNLTLEGSKFTKIVRD